MSCVMTGAQEAPALPSPTAAFGCGRFLVDTNARTLTYHIVFTNLSSAESAAHIHGFADPGTPAGVVHALPAGSPKIGVWQMTEEQMAEVLAGRTYVNVHSANNPGGEIRGQIVHLNAILDGAQETPAVPTSGFGFGVFMIDTIANELSYYISYGNLSGTETAAHIHGFAGYGTPAGILHPLPAANPKVGVWNYAESQEQAILDGLTYVNIHTTDAPGGEIRGQITPIVVPLDGSQEVPPVSTAAAACGLFSMDPVNRKLGYDIRYGGIQPQELLAVAAVESAAHIHGYAPRGANAGVVHPLPAGSRKLGSWEFGETVGPLIRTGLTYANVHTNDHPGGEIRGQIEFPRLPLVYGDANGDELVSNLDALMVQARFLDLIDCLQIDTNCDGLGPEF